MLLLPRARRSAGDLPRAAGASAPSSLSHHGLPARAAASPVRQSPVRQSPVRRIATRLRIPDFLRIPERAPAPAPAPAPEAAPVAAGRTSLWSALRRPETRTPVLLALGVVLANNAMAALALQGFATQILSRAGVGEPLMVALLVGVTKTLGVAICVALVDRTGRRPLLRVGALGMLCCHALIAYGFACERPTVVAVALVSLFFWWNMSWAGLMWTVLAEVLPDSVRAVAMGMAIVIFWLTNFATSQSVETLLDVLSPQLTFGLFSLGCVAALAFVQCCLPETKGALTGTDTDTHAPHGSPSGHEPRVGPPTCRALMGDSYGGGGGGGTGARRSRASDSPGNKSSGRASSVDSDDVEWSGAVRSSVDPRTRYLAMH